MPTLPVKLNHYPARANWTTTGAACHHLGVEIPLVVERFGKRYRGNWIVDSTVAAADVSFEVRQGEIVGLLGPNGAGKTTTFRAVTGLVRPTTGRIEIFGLPPRLRQARERLGFLPEEASFHDFLTGQECVTLAATLSGVAPAERARRVSEVLDRVGLGAARARRLRTYSKGMKQRVGIAQAIVGRPQLVILDEPMTGLDPIGRREIRDLIAGLPQEGASVVFSTHVLQDVELACDRVVILSRGSVLREGRLEDLLAGRDEPIEVTARGVPDERSRDLLAAFGGRHGSGGRLVFRVRDLRAADELRAAVAAAGGEVVSQQPLQRTLEDVFLSEVATGDAGARPA